jgi:hypothetical protein
MYKDTDENGAEFINSFTSLEIVSWFIHNVNSIITEVHINFYTLMLHQPYQ